MSWLPLYNSWLFFMALLSFFLWKIVGVFSLFCLVGLSVFMLISEVMPYKVHYELGFWLFILSEVAIFGTLFVMCLWSMDGATESISSATELPLLGSFLLIGSSITATTYHHCRGLNISWVFLAVTIVLGLSFILLQAVEFYECECDVLNDVYYSSVFCTVGLHFSHVFVGVLGLSVLMLLGANTVKQSYDNVAVWYWHFVDYVWLLVFFLLYFL
uniref:cytochrome c oxidase subunit III n=1 Tax=Paragonimus iloktsuenensis TaxID=62813 RepID=UPI00233F4185|nr:cytochrome c oxidase subunit III [Paragonimus iloktsuenensis]WBU12989.1 cytochrome c oxidase subunit III [Paragonimus iloktsuenensis]